MAKKKTPDRQKHTTAGIRHWSPTGLLFACASASIQSFKQSSIVSSTHCTLIFFLNTLLSPASGRPSPVHLDPVLD
jgi:hypothetical protein